MLFGKHINKYYLKYAHWLLLGILSLVLVDYMQLIVPQLYRTVINGINNGFVVVDGNDFPFGRNMQTVDLRHSRNDNRTFSLENLLFRLGYKNRNLTPQPYV